MTWWIILGHAIWNVGKKQMIPKIKYLFLYCVLLVHRCLAICATFICCLNGSYSEHFHPGVGHIFIVLQAIVDFLPNIIQTYQYIACVYRISVQLYSFENHILVITQQFLVSKRGTTTSQCGLSEKYFGCHSYKLSYHFITEDPGTYMWTSSLTVVSDGYYHPTTTM